MLLLFSVISATAQEPQNIKDNSFWVYPFDYPWFIKKWDGDCRYSERFTVIGKSEKNGKLYFTLQFIRISEETDSGSSSSYFHDDDEIYMYHIITLQKGQAYNQISIREEKGQFLVDKDEYMTALNDENYGGKVGNPDYVPYEMTEDNELILYDFTKREGDIYAYSQEGEPITVTSVEPVVTDDNVRRNLMTLSNNLKIIEGIGCINSQGTFIYYLNPGKRNHQLSCLDWYMYNNRPGDYDWVLWHKDYKDILILAGINKGKDNTIETSSNTLHDLQGRRLLELPRKGVYIRDGRKLLVK